MGLCLNAMHGGPWLGLDLGCHRGWIWAATCCFCSPTFSKPGPQPPRPMGADMEAGAPPEEARPTVTPRRTLLGRADASPKWGVMQTDAVARDFVAWASQYLPDWQKAVQFTWLLLDCYIDRCLSRGEVGGPRRILAFGPARQGPVAPAVGLPSLSLPLSPLRGDPLSLPHCRRRGWTGTPSRAPTTW